MRSISLPPIEIRKDPAKRAFDIAFSSLVLLLTGPLLLIIVLLIRLTSPGPAFFRKAVLGRGGREISMLKFRTMYEDAEERLHELLRDDSAVRAEWEGNQKLVNDPRITPIGRFLRKYSLDEFPQFWNVLCGEFSVVGPRPYLSDPNWYYGDQLPLFLKAAPEILSIRPGITGIWATSGRADLTYHDRVRLDCRYVGRQRLLYDVGLILKTIPALVCPRGAY